MGRHLCIDFSWIYMDFGGQVGAMLGSKIDQKLIQKGIKKHMRKRKRLGVVLEASWGVLEAWRRCTGARWRGRRGHSRIIRKD